MGTSIPPPFDPPPVTPGDPCSACWGLGKPFGDVDTPSSIWIRVSGMNKGPGWNAIYGEAPDGDFELFQLPAFNCRYEAFVDNWWFRVFYFAGDTQSQIIVNGITIIFSTTPNPACSILLPNISVLIFVGGTMAITV